MNKNSNTTTTTPAIIKFPNIILAIVPIMLDIIEVIKPKITLIPQISVLNVVCNMNFNIADRACKVRLIIFPVNPVIPPNTPPPIFDA